MRYYSYKTNFMPGNDDRTIETVSEDEIRRHYWPSWYKQMCDKYEQAYVDEHYCFEDCLEHWIIKHRAWLVSG